MRKLLLLFFGLFFSFLKLQAIDPDFTWKEIAEFGGKVKASSYPGARTNAFTCSYGSKLYVYGGYRLEEYQDFWSYDTITHVWEKLQPCPENPNSLTGIYFQDGRYIYAGKNNLYRYDIVSKIWTTLHQVPTGGKSKYPIAFVLDNHKAYYGLGYDVSNTNGWVYNGFAEYDIATDTWISHFADFTPYQYNHFALAAFNFGNKASFIFSYQGSSLTTNEVWLFDPNANPKWVKKGNTPVNFNGISKVTVVNGIGYIAEMFTKKIYAYNPVTDSWSVATTYPGASDASWMLEHIGNTIFMGYGDELSVNKDLWKFDMTNNNWKYLSGLHIDDSFLFNIMTFAANNKGYALLSDVNGYVNSPVYEYDPVTDEWTKKQNAPFNANTYNQPFSIHNITYVSGKKTHATETQNKYWKYNSVLDQWDTIAPLPGNLRQGTSAFTIGDTGYVAFGVSIPTYYPSDIYAYMPNTNSWQLRTIFPVSSGQLSGFASVYSRNIYTTGRKIYFDSNTFSPYNTNFGAILNQYYNGLQPFLINNQLYTIAISKNSSYTNNPLLHMQDTALLKWEEIIGADFPARPQVKTIGFSINNEFCAGMGQYSGNPYFFESMYKLYDQRLTAVNNHNFKEDLLLVYPNPVENQITVQSEMFANAHTITVSVYDMLGKQIPVITNKESDRIIINTDNLPSGEYILNVIANGNYISKKIVK